MLIENTKQTSVAAISENVILNFLSNVMCYWRPWKDPLNTLCLVDAAGSGESGLKSCGKSLDTWGWRTDGGGKISSFSDAVDVRGWQWHIQNSRAVRLASRCGELLAEHVRTSLEKVDKSMIAFHRMSLSKLSICEWDFKPQLCCPVDSVPNWSIDS